MATTFKELSPTDFAQDKFPVHELVPVDGAVINYTDPYGTYPTNDNIKELPSATNAMFLRLFDADYAYSGSNVIMDMTVGVHPDSLAFNTPVGSGVTNHPWIYEWGAWAYDDTRDEYGTKRQNMYQELAQWLVGFDESGAIREFDTDGNFATTGDKLREVIALNLSRIGHKDGIRKGTFQLMLGMNPYGYTHAAIGGLGPFTPFTDYAWNGPASSSYIKITDYYGSSQYKVNSPRGEYGILYAQNCDSAGTVITTGGALDPVILDADFKVAVGLIYYQAGVVIITPWLFGVYNANLWSAGRYGFVNTTTSGLGTYQEVTLLYDSGGTYGGAAPADWSHFYNILDLMNGYEPNPLSAGDDNISMTKIGQFFRQRILSLQYVNDIEVNSMIVFCHAGANEFNYSSNPTYTDNSRIVTKNVSTDMPVAYITELGLYSQDHQLLAVGTFSRPFKKTPATAPTFRARLDF